MYSRTPAGGPLRGGTRVTIIGEGLDGFGITVDEINSMLVDENLLGRGTHATRSLPSSAHFPSCRPCLLLLGSSPTL